MKDSDVKAVELFRKSAEQGDLQGQFRYGECLRDGKGVPQDLAEAQKWFQRAADAGHTGARQALGQLQPAQTAQSQTPAPMQPAPSVATPSAGKGGLYAVVAASVAVIVFANSCKETTPGGFFSAGREETNWGGVWIGTAVVAFIAYLVGKNSK